MPVIQTVTRSAASQPASPSPAVIIPSKDQSNQKTAPLLKHPSSSLSALNIMNARTHSLENNVNTAVCNVNNSGPSLTFDVVQASPLPADIGPTGPWELQSQQQPWLLSSFLSLLSGILFSYSV